MDSSTLTPTKPQATKPPKCLRCRGMGEIVARVRPVGGGCVNDDWDLCPACNGTGEAKPTVTLAPDQAELLLGLAKREVRDTLRYAADNPGCDFTWRPRMDRARAALAALGWSREQVDAFVEEVDLEMAREIEASWSSDPKAISYREVEALR